MGRLLAWQLLRRGHRVELFDRDSATGDASAARVAAAMLAPYSEVVACERAIFDWGCAALPLWPALLAELQADTGCEVFFQRRGSVVVAHGRDRNLWLQFNQRLLRSVPEAAAAVQQLDRAALLEVEPDLAQFAEATWLKDEGTLDNRELLQALERALRSLGVQWHECVAVAGVHAGALEVDGTLRNFDLAVDTRGFGAREQLPGLRGVRGEVLWVRAPEVQLSRPVRLMHPRYQLYIAPKRAGVYVIGATEIESEALTPITVRSSLELQSALYSVHTGFAEAQVLHAYANCRPAFIDNLPRIDSSAGLLRVNGLYRHGYLLAPLMLQLALATLDGAVAHPVVRQSEQLLTASAR
jgi:glycine oxidase